MLMVRVLEKMSCGGPWLWFAWLAFSRVQLLSQILLKVGTISDSQNCICRTSYANPYCPSSSHSGKNEENKHQRHSKGDGNPKAPCVQKRNRQSIEPSPALSFCCGQQSGSTHLICHTQHVFPIPLNNRKVPGFLRTRVIWQGSTTTGPLQDSTASASSLVSAMLILERIVSTIHPQSS